MNIPTTYVDQAERYMMHKLYHLEAAALDGYQTYNFAKGTVIFICWV
jgi:hypothetical protein